MSAAGGTHPPAVQPPAEPSCLLQQGTLDDYVVEKAIGRGHFSVVHRAQRRSDDRRVALKKIKIFDMMDAKARDRCLKEVQLLQTLEAHPSIIQYLDAFLADNVLYIVFEWAEHGDLRRLLRRAAECSASLREPQIWRYFTQVCDGIRHMHAARVMHRDIKPANIFLAADGRVKLGDLGLGRAFSSQTYEAMSKVGTPLYMSPEVLDGRGYEWKSDIWSLGCLLYELATLRSPFKSQGEKDNLFSLFKKISVGKFAALPDRYSEQLAALVTWMIQTDPSRRPDIQQTLDAANAAEALAQEAAARPQSGGRSGGGGSGGVAATDAGLLADGLRDKLKILNYERGLLQPRSLPPLPPGYFTLAAAAPPPQQFAYLLHICCWLLNLALRHESDLSSRLPERPSETDMLAAATAALETMGRSGGKVPELARTMAPSKLRAATGSDVCVLLNALADEALQARGFAWAAPCYAGAEQGVGDDVVEAVHETADAFEGGAGSAPVTSDEPSVGEPEWSEPGWDEPAAGRLLSPICSAIEPAAWREECARCRPMLKLQLGWSQLRWRHRLELMQRHAPSFDASQEVARPGLEGISERMGHEASALAPVRERLEELNAAAASRSARLAEAQARVDRLSAELEGLHGRIGRSKREVEETSNRISDRANVDALRSARRRLRRESVRLSLRCACLQKELARQLERREREPLQDAVDGVGEDWTS